MSATTLNGHIANVPGIPSQQQPPAAATAMTANPSQGPAVDDILRELLTAEPFPIQTLEQIIKVFYDGNKVEKKEAEKVLVQFKEHEAAWTKVDFILTHSQIQQTQFFGLQALEHTIDKQWKVLPRAQCNGIKDFIIGIIVEITQTAETMSAQKLYLSKLNVILVKIIKHDWPQHWPTALKDIVGAARSGESICQNNLEILRLLSEDIFDFSEDQMVQRKVQHLKESMCDEFSQVFELCYYVMSNSENEELILTCLRTLLRFTKWIPGGYIFETELIVKLTERLLPHPPFRNETLACLTEICTFDLSDQQADVKPQYEAKLVDLYHKTFEKLQRIIPLDSVNIREAYKTGSDAEQKLVSNLAQFLSAIFANHRELVMNQHPDEVLAGMRYLVQISYVDDMEVFKICLDFWLQFTQKLYNSSGIVPPHTAGWGQWGQQQAINNPAAHPYSDILSMARLMMICKMAKPEEVLVVENDQGEVVREMIKDTDSQAVYQNCKKTLVFLTNLDTRDTERLMQEKLSKQVDDSEWGWDALNRLCWSIGSISGSMSEEDERRFLVNVIKDLLGLCEQKRGKDNKAIIASNIMYVVGQYPRFLRNHWKFLKTVVNKLFEFMHESHEGVQDMACDTFLKITQKCKRHFVQLQQGESTPFVEEIIATTVQIISDLATHQVQAFYEAVGYMIAAQQDQNMQAQLIRRYMQLPDQVWRSLVQQAGQNVAGFFREPDNCRQLGIVLKTANRACKAIGHPFVVYLSGIYMDMMMIYQSMSKVIVECISQNINSLREPHIKDRRSIKREILSLVTLWVENCKDVPLLENQFCPHLFEYVVNDYMSCPAQVREAEVISCIKAVLVKLGPRSGRFTADIFQKIFEPTLNMIKVNDVDFPEHRRNFFQFLSAVNEHCFMSLLSLNQEQFKIVLGAIIWGMKQMMAECKEISLQILEKLLENVADPQIVLDPHAQEFYKNYYIYILEHIFEVATNILHAKANLQQHAEILAYMVRIVVHPEPNFNQQPRVTIQLSPEANNCLFVQSHITNLLKKHFNNITDPQIQVFVEGIFALYNSRAEFIAHLRDFLIQMKEKRGEDTSDLFLEERMTEIRAKKEQLLKDEKERMLHVPGMANPYQALADEELI